MAVGAGGAGRPGERASAPEPPQAGGQKEAAPGAGQGRGGEAGGPGPGPRLPQRPGRARRGAGSSSQRRLSAAGGTARCGLRGPARPGAACLAAAPSSARLLPFPSASSLSGPIPAGAPRAAGRCSGAAASPTGAACAEPPEPRREEGKGRGRGRTRRLSGGAEGLRQPGRGAERPAGRAGGQAGSRRRRPGEARAGRSCGPRGVGGLRAGAGLRRGSGRHFPAGRGGRGRLPPLLSGSARASTAGTRWSAKGEAGRSARPERAGSSLNSRRRLPGLPPRRAVNIPSARLGGVGRFRPVQRGLPLPRGVALPAPGRLPLRPGLQQAWEVVF